MDRSILQHLNDHWKDLPQQAHRGRAQLLPDRLPTQTSALQQPPPELPLHGRQLQRRTPPARRPRTPVGLGQGLPREVRTQDARQSGSHRAQVQPRPRGTRAHPRRKGHRHQRAQGGAGGEGEDDPVAAEGQRASAGEQPPHAQLLPALRLILRLLLSRLINLLMERGQFITSEGQGQVLVTEAYRDLNRAIDDMDRKVEHVIKKHEAEFLYAYRNHIAKIKKELAEIKHKSEEQEKMFSSNDRIQYLEKEMLIFREEALKLYSKLDALTQENEHLKNRIREIEKQQQAIDDHEREQIKSFKIEGMNKSMLESRNDELEAELTRKNDEIARLHRRLDGLREESNRRSQFENKERVASLASTRRGESLRGGKRAEVVYESEMKEWFLECVKTVKREVAMRNGSSSLLDLTCITGIEEFKTVDKLRLLELFLQNEKLLAWLYERIFPDRLAKLRYNLSSHNDSLTSCDKSDELNLSPVEKSLLPRVNRVAKSELRNSLIVKNGKLNISHV